ncbi:MAG: prepilin-type N-terminal cleavage/methylation domain-containing protein [Planctomycetes bacterium]|nr:prepilin-type N-terminal cleavage/methylation domain-containing protein [Planctomycetota bacterium]
MYFKRDMTMQNFKIRNSENSIYETFCRRRGFSLIEILTVLTLSATILAAVILIYNRVRNSAAAITTRLNNQGLPDELLQKIAEDIDRLAAPGFDASISIRNKEDSGYNSAQLVIENRYYGNSQPPTAKIYERVVWQSNYDPFLGQMVLYRSHSGLNLEDKLVDTVRNGENNPELFVPVCSGLTYFGVFALTGRETEEQEPASSWQRQTMPNGILLGLSLEPMTQLEDGSFVLPEGSIVYRAVAVDRTRPIPYKFTVKLTEPNDPNSRGRSDPNETKSSVGQSKNIKQLTGSSSQ